MLQATEKILSVTTDAQKVIAIGQLDACNKRLRALRAEFEKLNEAATSPSGIPIDWGYDQLSQEANLKKELEEQLEDEVKKRNALAKVVQSEKRKSRDLLNLSSQSKDIEVEILSTDRIIAKIKENLEILNSEDRSKITSLLQKHNEKKRTDTKGHLLAPRQFFKPTDCGVCLEPLWDTKNQGMECSSIII